jgi:hypothetical protein
MLCEATSLHERRHDYCPFSLANCGSHAGAGGALSNAPGKAAILGLRPFIKIFREIELLTVQHLSGAKVEPTRVRDSCYTESSMVEIETIYSQFRVSRFVPSKNGI